MSTAYVHDGALYCDAHAPDGAGDGYSDGGGETDSPARCDTCHVPLDAPLTSDGIAYVLATARETLREGRASYLTVHACYAGTYYAGSPHVAIVRDWMEALEWYNLDDADARFVTRFLSWTAHAMERAK